LNATKDYKLPKHDATSNSSAIIAHSTSSANTYFGNQEQAKIERESLERIHTFSLKEPNDDMNNSADASPLKSRKIPVEGALGEIPRKAERETTRNQGIRRNQQQNTSCESDRSGRVRNASIGSR
jgi:hypothetical protein